MIAFVCHVHFEEDQFQRDLQVCGFFYLSIKILSSFISFHGFNVLLLLLLLLLLLTLF